MRIYNSFESRQPSSVSPRQHASAFGALTRNAFRPTSARTASQREHLEHSTTLSRLPGRPGTPRISDMLSVSSWRPKPTRASSSTWPSRVSVKTSSSKAWSGYTSNPRYSIGSAPSQSRQRYRIKTFAVKRTGYQTRKGAAW